MELRWPRQYMQVTYPFGRFISILKAKLMPTGREVTVEDKAPLCSFSCVWQLGCRVAIILLARDYTTEAVPLYQ